jgi:hypothetical protein
MVPEAGLKVTLPMLGRVALLVRCNNLLYNTVSNFLQRHILIDVNGGQKFWDKVDEELAAIRNKFENDETRISKYVFSQPSLSISSYVFAGQLRWFLRTTATAMATPIFPSSLSSIVPSPYVNLLMARLSRIPLIIFIFRIVSSL